MKKLKNTSSALDSLVKMRLKVTFADLRPYNLDFLKINFAHLPKLEFALGRPAEEIIEEEIQALLADGDPISRSARKQL